ncbi:MAG: PKD domain-containing protein [Burkholderiaceae bacterium]|nr:PKD domain-containing protein [Burkholderiaceae bacterium]
MRFSHLGSRPWAWLRALTTCLALAATAQASVAQTYRLTNLGPSNATAYSTQSINAKGQVVYTVHGTTTTTPPRSYLYDGTTSIEVGTLGFESGAGALNDLGQVAGTAVVERIAMPGGWFTNVTHAFVWSQAAGVRDIGKLGGRGAYAEGINNAGQVIGQSEVDSGRRHAFFWSASTGMLDLTPTATAAGTAGINAAGQVAGWYQESDGVPRGFLWSLAGGFIELPLFPADLNDAGQVVGHTLATTRRAALWSAGTGLVDLGTLGDSDSWARSINASGTVAGGYRRSDGSLRAFTWSSGTGMVDLGNLPGGTTAEVPYAQTIHSSGSIVGNAVISDGSFHAFIWTRSGGMRDLNQLVANPPAGLHLIQAFGIAENGSILAQATTGPVLLSATASAPVLGSLDVDDPLAVGAQTRFSAAFTDPNPSDTHTAQWSWGDGSPDSYGTISESAGSGSAVATHAYAAAGVYTVTLTVTDNAGQKATASREISVFDASRGHVTGAGWFRSPKGALKAAPNEAGHAHFALVTRYVPGEARPPGRTVFHLRGAALHFRGLPQGPVTISGARATYSGTGRLNGVDGYQFAVTAIDAKLNGSGIGRDRLRLRIWHVDASGASVVDYDNLTDAASAGTLREGSVVQRGRITIRSRPRY